MKAIYTICLFLVFTSISYGVNQPFNVYVQASNEIFILPNPTEILGCTLHGQKITLQSGQGLVA